MFFRRKTKENHAKSVQNVRKLLFSPGKTKEKQKKKKRPPPPKKKDPKTKSTRTVQAHPTSLLRLMLHAFSSSNNPGEWGVHLLTFGVTPEVTLRSNIMLLPLCVHAPSQTLQERVDAWASSIGRPVLHGRVATVHLSLEEVCIRTQGIRDASWPFIRPCPQLTDVLWLPGLGPDGNFLHYQYEIRTLVCQHSSEAFGLSYTATHWASQKRSHSAKPSVSAANDTTKLSLLVLRSTGQAKFSEECVHPSL